MPDHINAPISPTRNVISAPLTERPQHVDAKLYAARDAYQISMEVLLQSGVHIEDLPTRAEWAASLVGTPPPTVRSWMEVATIGWPMGLRSMALTGYGEGIPETLHSSLLFTGSVTHDGYPIFTSSGSLERGSDSAFTRAEYNDGLWRVHHEFGPSGVASWAGESNDRYPSLALDCIEVIPGMNLANVLEISVVEAGTAWLPSAVGQLAYVGASGARAGCISVHEAYIATAVSPAHWKYLGLLSDETPVSLTVIKTHADQASAAALAEAKAYSDSIDTTVLADALAFAIAL